MALGVLNNLSAIYAEHNLNNTSSSLQTVLQQLSSGSRINSGADDAAGLSLVNGLKANSTALTQSSTNATEGVGLLQVADGALSQVTSLLNRAITLATEASNGTLNSTQDGAANMEYQSIMAEINNIGSTTTYNQQTVFSGTNIAIYTGDSSTNGSAIDSLNIHTLSQAGVGDTNGVMSYGNSSGSTGSNVFINLSNDGTKASLGDTLNSSGITSIVVKYLQTGAGGAVTVVPQTITVGANTSYPNTAQGLMNAINNAGLGLTATFGTAAQAGSGALATALAASNGGGSGSDTGIIITGTGVGTGTTPGEIGSLTVAATPLAPLTGTLTVTAADGTNHVITLGQADSTDTLANLAATIDADNYGITANVSIGGPASSTITFTSTSSTAAVSGTNLGYTQTLVDAAPAVNPGTLPTGAASGIIGTLNLTNATDILTGGTLVLTGEAGVATSFALGLPGTTDTLANLAKTITNWAATGNGAGITAVVSGTGVVISSAGRAGGAQTAISNTATTAATSNSVAASSSPVSLAATPLNNLPSVSTIGTLALTGGTSSVTDVLVGTLTIGSHTITLGGTGTTDNLQDLAKTIDAGAYGVTATYSQSAKNIVFTSSNAALTASFIPAALTSGDQTNASGALSYNPSSPVTVAQDYYSVGISTAGILDQSTAVLATNGGTANTAITSDASSTGGTATISYVDAAGQSLMGTTLLNQASAQAALTVLNLAIGDISAQDGYIGSQINTLNSISQVMSTQQENVVSAQNAIQATDYASATSNMSKYEILSQTGIAALAQANQVEQEVTKLLQ